MKLIFIDKKLINVALRALKWIIKGLLSRDLQILVQSLHRKKKLSHSINNYLIIFSKLESNCNFN